MLEHHHFVVGDCTLAREGRWFCGASEAKGGKKSIVAVGKDSGVGTEEALEMNQIETSVKETMESTLRKSHQLR